MKTDLLNNVLTETYPSKKNVILLAHELLGTVRGKSANGLMIHNELFNVVALIDKNAVGKLTSDICQGVQRNIPIYPNVEIAGKLHEASILIILCAPNLYWHTDIKEAVNLKLDIINTSFDFIKNNQPVRTFMELRGTKYFDLRDVTNQQAYPNTAITKRKARVIYVSGTDCGLGKRTAAYELLKEARRRNIKATMLATGQTGLMLGERGTVVDSLVIEFSNGIVSQQICQLDDEGFELILVEGQSDIFHPANSAMALAILHGANPDGIILVHDETRKVHKGFEENADLYKMHDLQRYIKAFEVMSLPCGPEYKTIGIATIGDENIRKIRKITAGEIIVEDALTKKGAALLLDEILTTFPIESENSVIIEGRI